MVVKVARLGPMIVTKEVKSWNLIYHRDVLADVQTAFYPQTNDILRYVKHLFGMTFWILVNERFLTSWTWKCFTDLWKMQIAE